MAAAATDPVWQDFHALLQQCMQKFGSAAQSADVVCSTSAWERDYHDSLKVKAAGSLRDGRREMSILPELEPFLFDAARRRSATSGNTNRSTGAHAKARMGASQRCQGPGGGQAGPLRRSGSDRTGLGGPSLPPTA
jgi:hypothetical protein